MARPQSVDNSKAAKLIFSRIGKEFPIKSHPQLRTIVGCGMQSITQLKSEPEKLGKRMLVRFARAVNIEPSEVLTAAGVPCSEDEIHSICKELDQPNQVSGIEEITIEDLEAVIQFQRLVSGPITMVELTHFLAARQRNRIASGNGKP